MPVELNSKQIEARDKTVSFVKNYDGVSNFMVSGLAGTGKTETLVQTVDALRAAGFRPAVATPTGKAAHVINGKQSSFIATTLHKVLTTRPLDRNAQIHDRLDELASVENGRPLTEDEELEQQELFARLDDRANQKLGFEPCNIDKFMENFNVLVFDESSMIGRGTYDELIGRMPVPKVFFGDAAQLPPVQDKPAVDLRAAHVRLDKIMRQADGSGILKVAHHIYQRKDYPKLSEMALYKDITVRKDFTPDTVHGFETTHQVLCWKNSTRWAVNRQMRDARQLKKWPAEYAAYPYLPYEGEQFMIDENDEDKRLLKGQLMTMKEIVMFRPNANPFMATVMAEDESGNTRKFTLCLTDMVESYGIDLKTSQSRVMNDIRDAQRNAIKVLFPYCLTVHKAQGSEWPRVLYLAEMPQGHKEWRMHAYTAVTRASEEIVLCDYAFKFDNTG